MVAAISIGRKLLMRLSLLLAVLVVAACDPMATVGGGPTIDTRRSVPVALLVPQTAPQGGAGLSQSIENAARLAMADLSGVDVKLTVYDTRGTAAGAEAATVAALGDGAKIILGPVFAEAANAAGVVASRRGVNVLSFSNNPAIAGGNVFILGSTFQNTADRLVGYAARQGVRDIMIVHANSPAELTGRDAISRAIAANGSRLAGTASFDLSQQSVISAIPQIASQVRSNGAKAVFMTSGNDGAIPFLAELLPENGIENTAVQFIGLQRLDIPATALSLDGLQGAWFAVPDPGLAAQFNGRYQAAYGTNPHPLAGLAYDGIAAIGALVSAEGSDALTVPALTRPSGFVGVNGVFRLRPNGTNERGLAVATIQDRQVTYLDPAPRSFGTPGL